MPHSQSGSDRSGPAESRGNTRSRPLHPALHPMEGKMKTVILYVHDDNGMESRMQAALDIARADNGHIECVTCKPLTALMLTDPFGATFMVPEAIQAVDEAAERASNLIEKRMAKEDVSWSLVEGDGDPAEILANRGRLADLIILSFNHDNDADAAMSQSLVGDVALAAPIPVLAVPGDGRPLALTGTCAILWNGSKEAANAIRAAVPLLKQAASVHLVTITDEAQEFAALDAASYLSRHGIKAEIIAAEKKDGTVMEGLTNAIDQCGAGWIVMGAYSRGPLREWLFGGVTHDILSRTRIPLFIAH